MIIVITNELMTAMATSLSAVLTAFGPIIIMICGIIILGGSVFRYRPTRVISGAFQNVGHGIYLAVLMALRYIYRLIRRLCLFVFFTSRRILRRYLSNQFLVNILSVLITMLVIIVII